VDVRADAVQLLARAGLTARAVVYGVIGVIAIDVAVGERGHQANQQGALELIARQTLGGVLLGLVAAGLAGYAAWRLTHALLGRGSEVRDTAFDRVAAAASAVVYGAMCAIAIKILAGSAGGGGAAASPRKETAGVLGWTGGPVLVTIAGVILVGIAAYQAHKALAKTFMETSRTAEMGARVRRAYEALGVFGHLARAVVFALTGYGLVRAALDYDPHKAVGLDEALRSLAENAYGPVLLGVVAAGLIAFAGYSAADARYRKV
jgi:hypothetical protein